MRAKTLTISLILLSAGAAQAAPDPVPCLIEPEAVVQLSTATAGIVAEVRADRGDTVRAGDVLARLDSQLEEIALALARARSGNETRMRALEARVGFLEGQAARAAELATRSAVAGTAVLEAEMEAEMARQDLAEARLAFDLAALEVAQAEAALAQKEVRAPFDGVVTERLLSVGEYRDGQAHILTLARLDMLRVEAFAPLSLYPQIALGQAVTVNPEAPVGGSHAGTITVIDRVFDAASGTFGLRAALPNPDLALPAGLRCDMLFESPPAGAGGN
ncbi:MAG TPA: efflux RND transporter periplasmic adaptor subunit [Paracoccaceae bacterium]|nr:efflux RND transporter periplasmic adaptor subunit [Paracoccaceae bacterium]